LDTLIGLVIGGRAGSSESKEGTTTTTDLTSVWTVVAKLLTDDELSQDIRDKLLAYQDVSDHGVRKSLSKTADSNSTDQRNASYETSVESDGAFQVGGPDEEDPAAHEDKNQERVGWQIELLGSDSSSRDLRRATNRNSTTRKRS
jgi:hypothetical protein